MASTKLVESSRKWFNSLSERKFQRYANANEGKHTRKLRRVLKRTETVLLKDSDTGLWYEA
jgi:hypothetical protein